MGFLFSIIYFVISFLTPEALFGSLAQYHIQVIITGLTLFFSMPKLLQSPVLKAPQTFALICLAFAGSFSTLIGRHWLGGAVATYIEFVSRFLAFFFVYLNFDTKKRLRTLVIALFVVSLFIISRGATELVSVSGSYGPPIDPRSGSVDLAQWDSAHPYMFQMGNSEGQWLYRIRGLGMINDPNDFAQFLVCMVPLMFIFWRPKKLLLNLILVIIPVAMLLVGVFLTHSRSALLALTAMALIAGRRKVGTVPAIVLATSFFATAMALQFSGGRQISATAGEDRTALWGEGIAAFRAHPFFGVGFGDFPAYTDSNLTAHNTVIVCAAELGLVGFYCWSVFLFATLKDAYATSSANRIKDGEPVARDDVHYLRPASVLEPLDKEDINILGRAVFLSLVGYLVAGWFLSRAIIMLLFMLGGLAGVVYQMALTRGMVSKRLPSFKLLQQSAALAAGLLITLYVVVRALNFVR
jgi:hypothetical protein